MFKNVAQALKITNHLKDETKKSADAKKAKSKKQDEAGEVIYLIKDEGFLVRRGRKKFNKLVARLQNVRSLSARNKQSNKKEDHDDSDSKTQDTSKEKVVKFKLDEDDPDGVYFTGDKSDFYQEDSDDDDAYVSASETFDDFEEPSDGNTSASGSQCYEEDQETTTTSGPSTDHQVARSYSEDELANDKFILPEELCDIPTFLNTKNGNPDTIEETRKLLKERYANNPDSFYQSDYERMLADDWTVTRFLLRRRMDPARTSKLMEECGKFRRQYLMGEVQLWEFPVEFHLAGGLFKYAPDRVGNLTMYMRIKMYRRVPEISDVFKAFILCVLEQCDVESNGRGTAVVFDLSGCGLQNVDLGFLYWLLNSFRNYCPKGVSYILVLNLPWFLSATAKLAMTWMSETNRRALRFVQGKEIENFIAPENLPDYLGGTCPIDYRAIPEGSRPAVEVCDRMDLTPTQALKIKQLFKEYLPENYEANLPPPSTKKTTTTTMPNEITNETHPRDLQQQQQQQQEKNTFDGAGLFDGRHHLNSDNHSQGSSSTLEAGSVPLAELVTKANQELMASEC